MLYRILLFSIKFQHESAIGIHMSPPSWASLPSPSPFHPSKLIPAKVGGQETPGVTGKFGLGMGNEAGQRLIEFCQENALVRANTLFQQHKRRLYTWTSPDGQHQNQTDYILCTQRWRSSNSQQKQDQELTVAQIMNSLLPNSDLNWRKQGKPLDHSGMT